MVTLFLGHLVEITSEFKHRPCSKTQFVSPLNALYFGHVLDDFLSYDDAEV